MATYPDVGFNIGDLIGNPLFVPSLDEVKENSAFLPPRGEWYNLLPFSTEGGLWVGYSIIRHEMTGEPYLLAPDHRVKDGYLTRLQFMGHKLFYSNDYMIPEKITINAALDEGLLEKTTYQDAFEGLGILPLFEQEIEKIPKNQNQIYQVAQRSDIAIDLDNLVDNNTKRRKLSDWMKEFLESLVPKPQLGPNYSH